MANFKTIITYNQREESIESNSLATMNCNGQLMATAVTVKTPEIIPTALASYDLEASRPTSGTGSGAGEILIKAVNDTNNANTILYIEGSDSAPTTVSRAVNLQTIDTNFIAENIRSGKQLFGVTGTYAGTEYETYLGGITVGAQFVITGSPGAESDVTELYFTPEQTWYAWCNSGNNTAGLTCAAADSESPVFWQNCELYTVSGSMVYGQDPVKVANYFCKDLVQS